MLSSHVWAALAGFRFTVLALIETCVTEFDRSQSIYLFW